MKRRLIVLAVLVAVAVAVAVWWEQRPRTRTLVLTGTVDGNEVVVGSKITGRIVSLAVDDGQRVNAGDLIAVLDQDELRADQGAAGHAIAQARANAQQAVAQTELLASTLPTKVQQSGAQVEQTEAQLQQNQTNLGQLQTELFPAEKLIEEAYQDACRYQTTKASKLNCDLGPAPIVVSGDRAALKHALTEVMLNALQANPADPRIGVHLHAEQNGNGPAGLEFDVQDNGAGFTPEAAQKAFEPFFTTRNVGLGLGLTVSRKVIGTHQGRLEIVPSEPGTAGVIRIFLPFENSLVT